MRRSYIGIVAAAVVSLPVMAMSPQDAIFLRIENLSSWLERTTKLCADNTIAQRRLQERVTELERKVQELESKASQEKP